MAGFDLKQHADHAMYMVIAGIAIALAFGIGSYILVQLNNASGGNIQVAVDMFNSQASMINTIVTFLFVGVVAGIGIALVLSLRSGMGFGAK